MVSCTPTPNSSVKFTVLKFDRMQVVAPKRCVNNRAFCKLVVNY